RENLRMLRHPRAVVVFDLPVDGHDMLPVLSQRVAHGVGPGKSGSSAKAGNRFPLFRIILYECGMKVDGKPTRTIWLEADGWSVGIIDQTVLPHRFTTLRLVTVDVGTATAPIYTAHDKGIAVHVWVDETRPRNQGASLTAWELGKHGVLHTVIADNTGGHLMQHGMVDMAIVGTDRVTAQGDVCNKIGTYLKALAA